jgi:uncharacterized membrane protein
MASIINIKWTWLIISIICFVFHIFVIISYYTSENNTSSKRGYGNLLSFSNLFIFPVAILSAFTYYIFFIVMQNSRSKISKASSSKKASSDD